MSVTLTRRQLHVAQSYNAKMAVLHWKVADLAKPWCDLAPASEEFALRTAEFQKARGLVVDGGLGPRTLSMMRDNPPEPYIEAAVEVPPPATPTSGYGWKNNPGAPVPTPTPGGDDGWDDVMSICDHHIWSRGDADLTRDKVRKREDIVACVLHTTGYGEGVERLDKKFGVASAVIDSAYAERLASILEYKGDFFIGRTGYLCMMSPLHWRTYHSVSSFQKEYSKEGWLQITKTRQGRVKVNDWALRYPELKSPLELPGFQGYGKSGKRDINLHTWSIDLLAPKPGETYTEEQYETAARLIWYVHETYQLPIDKFHVCGHSDINPLDRANLGGLWDPGPGWDWDRVFARITELRGK